MARGVKTGGRKPGSKNKRTEKIEAAKAEMAAKILLALGDGVFDGDAHELLMVIYKNAALPIDLRLDAAKAAIRFEKPQLASTEVKSETTVRYVARVPNKAVNPIAWQDQQQAQPSKH